MSGKSGSSVRRSGCFCFVRQDVRRQEEGQEMELGIGNWDSGTQEPAARIAQLHMMRGRHRAIGAELTPRGEQKQQLSDY